MNEHPEEMSDEELANDRWENEGGHTEGAILYFHRKHVSGGCRLTDAAIAIRLVKAST
jgi:hypothetical protein